MNPSTSFAAVLSINPFFSGLSPDAIQQIADLCIRKNLADGESLFLKGDPGDALYGVRRGRILIRTGTLGGKQLTLNVLGPGDLFGEIALLDGRARSADAVAAEPTELFIIRRADFHDLLQRQPSIALRLIELLCERIRWVSERAEEASLLSLSHRLARRLLKLADDFGQEVQISQEELSVLVGVARESVNRQLQHWQRAGILNLRRGRIEILSMTRLQAEAADPE